MSRVPPQDINAEQAVLGCMLLSTRALEDAGRILNPSDFYKPSNGAIYGAILGVYAAGAAVDPNSVAAFLTDRGQIDQIGGPSEIVTLLSSPPAVRNALTYAQRVLEVANRRRLIGYTVEAADQLYEGTSTADVVESLIDQTSHLDSADLDAEVTDLVTFEQWISEEARESRWVIPGMMRSEWRMILTAPAGVGKATLMRQIAYASSVGVHPFTLKPMPPIRTLYVDLENPVSTVISTGRKMVEQAGKLLTLDNPHTPKDCMIWSRQGGINLRGRRDRLDLERRIRKVRPDLVCLGPVYKSFQKDSKINAEEITMEVCEVFDDLRTRYDFALILEHHSPRGSTELFPFGSSVWERWPEFGRTLRPPEKVDPTMPPTYEFGKYRPDRVPVTWPRWFRWSKDWPFEAIYNRDANRGDPGPIEPF